MQKSTKMTVRAVTQSVDIYWAPTMCLPCAISTEDPVVVQLHPYPSTPANNLAVSTFEMPFQALPSQWGRCPGAAAQPIPRQAPAPSGLRLSSLPPTKTTAQLNSFTAGKGKSKFLEVMYRALGSQPPASPPSTPPRVPHVLVTLTSVPFVSEPSITLFIYPRYPFPLSTGHAPAYPSRPRPNGTSSGKPPFPSLGRTHWTVIFLFVYLFPQETALCKAREHIQKPCRHRDCWRKT